MEGLAISDIKIYKNGSTPERASTSGFTLLDTDGIDFDGITGFHGISIDLSSNDDSGFYTAGALYWVVISSVTIEGQIVNIPLCTFDIGYDGAALNTTIATISSQTSFTLTTGPAEDDALVGCDVIIHDIASPVQWSRGYISGYTGATKTVTLSAIPTFTIAAGDNVSIFLPASINPAQTPSATPVDGTADEGLKRLTDAGGGTGVATALNVSRYGVQVVIATVANAGDFTISFEDYAGNIETNGQFDGMMLMFDDGPNQNILRRIGIYTGTGTYRLQFPGTTHRDGAFPNLPAVGNRATIIGRG